MSQIHARASGSEPAIPTSFRTDRQLDFAFDVGSGVATPVANQLQIYGDHGIETITNDSNTDVIHIRYAQGYDSTTDANSADLITFTPDEDSVVSFLILVSGLADNDDGVGGSLVSTFKNIGGTASIIGDTEITLDADASLTGVQAELVASGANVIVRVTGVAGRTIEWGANIPGLLPAPEPS